MAYRVNPRLIENQFFYSMRKCGIEALFDLDLEMDGSIHRFSVKGDKVSERSGAYYIYADEWPNWGIMDYRKHSGMQKFKFDTSLLNASELEEFHEQFNPEQRKMIEERKVEDKKLKAENERRSLEQAWNLYSSNTDNNTFCFYANVDRHPYLLERFLSMRNPNLNPNLYIDLWQFEYHLEGVKIPDYPLKRLYILDKEKNEWIPTKLIIPITNVYTRKFQTLQYISHIQNEKGKYNKGFYPGLPIKYGCYELIPKGTENSKVICLAEGICTGLSIIVLTKAEYPVFCALSSNNLMNVARGLRQRYEGSKIIIMADNDKKNELNPNIRKNTGVVAANEVIAAGLADYIRIPKLATSTSNKNIDWYDVLVEKDNQGGINE